MPFSTSAVSRPCLLVTRHVHMSKAIRRRSADLSLLSNRSFKGSLSRNILSGLRRRRGRVMEIRRRLQSSFLSLTYHNDNILLQKFFFGIGLNLASIRVMVSHGVNMGFNFWWKIVLLSMIFVFDWEQLMPSLIDYVQGILYGVTLVRRIL